MLENTVFRRIFYSFPIQLFILFFKRNHILLVYWLLLFGFITETLAPKWGIPYLFLDPEYIGRVDFWSFFIIGCSFGGFIMTYNISSYILNGYQFPFLATLSRPFLKYILNNFIVPLIFIGTYLYKFISFQLYNEYQNHVLILFQLAGFLAGLIIVITVTILYFTSTNKDIFLMFGIKVDPDNVPQKMLKRKTGRPKKQAKIWHVETYLSNPFKVRLVRGAEHYDREILMAVFRQNHLNAALLELFVFLIFILLGLFREHMYFRIPTGASITLLFSMFMMLLSAFRFWLRGWSNAVLVVLFLIFNYYSQFENLNPINTAYGLNYQNPPVEYSSVALDSLNNKKNYQTDYNYTLDILEKWKQKNQTDSLHKPKMIFINTSGGGLRAAIWTYRVLQVGDSVTNKALFSQSQLISGASGGLIGAAYFRELYKLYHEHKIPSYTSESHFSNISKDLLNPIALTITVSDMFLRLQKFTDGKYTYTKDRAYAFEKQLNENVNNIFNKRMRDYVIPEAESKIPMLVMNPTVLNDGRRLYISPHPVSYFSNNFEKTDFNYKTINEDIDFTRFFKDHDPGNLWFTSALRMSATFPYVLPNVALPSTPTIEVMDAGIRDNFGVRTSLKFLYVFRDWIEKNTSGVIFLQIRDTPQNPPFAPNSVKTIVQNITTPVGSFYGNFAKIQHYNDDEYFQYATSWYHGKMDFLTFQLPNEKEKISLSWHLTTREKDYIYNAIQIQENQQELNRLKNLLK